MWVVLAPDDPGGRATTGANLAPKLETVRCGGATRAESVTNGLQAAAMVAADDDWVLVHDAARPCISPPCSTHCSPTWRKTRLAAFLLAVPVADTLEAGGCRTARGCH